MPPKKLAAAGEDKECPILRLSVEKGPLSGQSNEFKPGSVIHIGRLVRGNTISIKDAGISSKHLRVQVELVSETGRRGWTVTDLESSNGTFLNDVQLEPSEPAALSEGDVIKLGEKATIRVGFEVNGGENDVNSRNVRRNARRGVRNQVGQLGVVDENCELKLDGKRLESEINLGAQFINEKSEDLGIDGGRFGGVDEEKSRGRRTRGSVAGELETGRDEFATNMKSTGKASSRRTRNSKTKEETENLIIEDDREQSEKVDEAEEQSDMVAEVEEQSDKVAEVEVKQGRNVGMRRTRASNKIESSLKDVGPSEVKGCERVSTRRTRSSRMEENLGEIVIDLDVIEGKKNRKGTRGRKKKQDETPVGEKEEEETNLEQEKCEEKKRSEVGVDEFVERVSFVREDAAGTASTSGVQKDAVDIENGEMEPDLEKMTLGEWFKFLEVYLPKQVFDATEEIICEMRQKAERLNEFMLQQKNSKDNGKAAMD